VHQSNAAVYRKKLTSHEGFIRWLHCRLHGLPCCARAGGTGQAEEAPCLAVRPAAGSASPQGSTLHASITPSGERLSWYQQVDASHTQNAVRRMPVHVTTELTTCTLFSRHNRGPFSRRQQAATRAPRCLAHPGQRAAPWRWSGPPPAGGCRPAAAPPAGSPAPPARSACAPAARPGPCMFGRRITLSHRVMLAQLWAAGKQSATPSSRSLGNCPMYYCQPSACPAESRACGPGPPAR
jgi:hypothetical protein